MKKFFALALALLLVLCAVLMTACGDKDPVDPVDPIDPADPADPVDPADPADPADPVDPITPGDVVVFENVQENVQVTVTVELRRQPALDVDNVVGNLRVNEIVARTGVSLDGTWSRVVVKSAGFEEGTYYVASACLKTYNGPLPSDTPTTPVDPITPEIPDASEADFILTNETVTVLDTINVRTSPSAVDSSNVYTQFYFGKELQCVARSSAWYRILYNGNEYYVASQYVTTQNISGNNFSAYATPVTKKVDTRILTVRSIPLDRYDNGKEINNNFYIVLDYLYEGDVVTCLGVSADGWTKIAFGDDGESVAYVGSKYLVNYDGQVPEEPTTPTLNFEPLTPEKTMYPKAGGNVNAYLTADILTAPAKTLSIADAVNCTAISSDGVWYRVTLEGDATPYYVLTSDLVSAGK